MENLGIFTPNILAANVVNVQIYMHFFIHEAFLLFPRYDCT